MRARRLSLGLLAIIAWACAVTACARGESAEERQMSEMREEIARVQADRDKFEQRVNALELQAADAQKAKNNTTAASAHATATAIDPSPTPNLRVITLSPDGTEVTTTSSETAASSAESDDPDDKTPRPVIRVRGTGRGDEHIEQTMPDDSSAASSQQKNVPMSSALDPAAQRAYDDALALVNSHQYGAALDAFAAFLVKYPDHPNADNATYWRGECYFAQQDYMRAAEQFEGVLARFPLGNKVPDALLKLGITQQKLGNADKAKSYFNQLLQQYPRSEAARRIPGDKS
jgi:tol-pal system protein YbgF